MVKGLLYIWVKSIGCPNCIAPVKTRFLRVKGVVGVHVLSGKIMVIYDPSITNPYKIIRDSRVLEYYIITGWRVRILRENEISKHIPRNTLKYGV